LPSWPPQRVGISVIWGVTPTEKLSYQLLDSP
jgi:hypothetical protein